MPSGDARGRSATRRAPAWWEHQQMPDGDMSALRAFPHSANGASAASAEDESMAALEARVRSALGVSRGTTGRSLPFDADRQPVSQVRLGTRRGKFVREGEVPVVMASGLLGGAFRPEAQATRRAAEAEAMLRAERTRAEALARDLEQSRDVLKRMEARIWTAEQDRDTAVARVERVAAKRLADGTADLEARLAASMAAERSAVTARDTLEVALRADRSVAERQLLAAGAKLEDVREQLRVALARTAVAKVPRKPAKPPAPSSTKAKRCAKSAKAVPGPTARAKASMGAAKAVPRAKPATKAATKPRKAVQKAATRPASAPAARTKAATKPQARSTRSGPPAKAAKRAKALPARPAKDRARKAAAPATRTSARAPKVR